jgi:hypothetical protein
MANFFRTVTFVVIFALDLAAVGTAVVLVMH